MSVYFFIFIVFIIVTFLLWLYTYKKYRFSWGLFFLLFSIAIPVWFILFFVSFNVEYGSEIILRIYRFQYSLSIIWFYSILFFVLSFWWVPEFFKNKSKYVYIGFIVFFLFSNFTPFLLQWVEYSEKIKSFSEIYGVLYPIVVCMYAILFPILGYVSYYKLKTLNNLDRLRLWYIVIWFLLFIAISLILTVFIPFFSSDSSQLYWERILPFSMLPFTLSVFYTSYRYNFSDIKVYLNYINIFIGAFLLSIWWLILLRVFLVYFDEWFYNFWSIQSDLTWFDIFLCVILFNIFYTILQRLNPDKNIKEVLWLAEEQAPFMKSIRSLNTLLEEKFRERLFVEKIQIVLCSDTNQVRKKFFEENPSIDFYIHDIVFFEVNKKKQWIHEMHESVWSDEFLIFPLRELWGSVQGFLNIGKKRFGDAYTSKEIKEFREFSYFVQLHLKYIETYKQIQDLTVSLDKRVDEKTIEYNTLLSKQKEFIAYIGHEIKNPITNTLFLADSLKSDVDALWDTEIRQDMMILQEELIKISSLVKHIFSTEKFDLDKVQLYTKYINVSDFLQSEIDAFQHKFHNINFIHAIEKDLYYEIDETQFRQVVQNLVNNAIKFINSKNPKISITLQKHQEELIFLVEDNGKGFDAIGISEVFWKYTTGESSSIGLGMGLYLCKKIVELHGWTIKAWNSQNFSWACFTIKLS